MQMFPNRFTAFLIFCIGMGTWGMAGSAMAQGSASLRILVISGEDGNPVTGANVLLLPPEEGEQEILYGGVSDSDGLHEFNNVPAGSYRLQVRFVGHETYTELMELEADQRRVERIVLPVDVEMLDELVVEAEREVTTGEVGLHRISSIDVARIPTPGGGGDLSSYLQTLPGVVTGGDRGGDLYIRGGTPTQNQVLVDNLPVIKPFHITNLFSAFPEETIQSVDLYAGGFGAEFLGATSAILDVSLRPGNMREFRTSGTISSHLLSFHAEGPVQTDRKSFFVMGRKSIMERTSPYITGRDDPIGFYDVIARYSYQGDGVACNITGLRTYDSGQINRYRNEELSWSNTAVGTRCLAYDPMFREPIEVTVGYTDYRNLEGPAGTTERSAGVQHKYFNLAHQARGFGTVFDYGFGVKFNRYFADIDERFSSVESFNALQAILQAHVSTEWEVHERLTLQPSLGTQVTVTTPPTLEPRLRLLYQPYGTGDTEISLAGGRYYQVDHGISDERDAGTVFTIIKSNEDGEPLQSAWHVMSGFRQRVTGNLLFNLEGYAKWHRNIPVSRWKQEAAINVETTLADGDTYGFDTRLVFDRRPLYLYVGYGFSYTRYHSAASVPGFDRVGTYSPPHDQRHKFNAIGSYDFAGFTTSLSWELGSGRPFTQVAGFDLALNNRDLDPLTDSGTARTIYSEPYGERLPAYHRLDLSVDRGFDLSPQWNLNAEVGVINFYDRRNVFFFDANTLQRVDQTPLMPYMSIKARMN